MYMHECLTTANPAEFSSSSLLLLLKKLFLMAIIRTYKLIFNLPLMIPENLIFSHFTTGIVECFLHTFKLFNYIPQQLSDPLSTCWRLHKFYWKLSHFNEVNFVLLIDFHDISENIPSMPWKSSNFTNGKLQSKLSLQFNIA